MSETAKKRNRGVNYTNDEKILLLNLVANFKHIIDNKKTDGVSNKQKEQAWENLTYQFNARALNVIRSTDSLKKYHDNIKNKTKQDVANEKISAIATGGGKLTDINDKNHILAMSLINAKTMVGLNNQFDFDSMEDDDQGCDIIIEDVISEQQNTTISDNMNDDNGSIIYIETAGCSNVNKEQEPTRIRDKSVNNLRTPVGKVLNKKWEKRRRSNLNEILQETHISLANAKIELINLQRSILLEENKLKMEREEIEFKLKIKSLELDIKLKENQINSQIKNES